MMIAFPAAGDSAMPRKGEVGVSSRAAIPFSTDSPVRPGDENAGQLFEIALTGPEAGAPERLRIDLAAIPATSFDIGPSDAPRPASAPDEAPADVDGKVPPADAVPGRPDTTRRAETPLRPAATLSAPPAPVGLGPSSDDATVRRPSVVPNGTDRPGATAIAIGADGASSMRGGGSDVIPSAADRDPLIPSPPAGRPRTDPATGVLRTEPDRAPLTAMPPTNDAAASRPSLAAPLEAPGEYPSLVREAPGDRSRTATSDRSGETREGRPGIGPDRPLPVQPAIDGESPPPDASAAISRRTMPPADTEAPVLPTRATAMVAAERTAQPQPAFPPSSVSDALGPRPDPSSLPKGVEAGRPRSPIDEQRTSGPPPLAAGATAGERDELGQLSARREDRLAASGDDGVPEGPARKDVQAPASNGSPPGPPAPAATAPSSPGSPAKPVATQDALPSEVELPRETTPAEVPRTDLRRPGGGGAAEAGLAAPLASRRQDLPLSAPPHREDDPGSPRLVGDPEFSPPPGTDLRAGEPRPGTEAAARADTPRAVLSQIVEVARQLPDGPVEISLSPEELGKVRLSLQGSDLQMTVQIMAERPETLDLIRRHIDLLAADLREQGFAHLSFSFARSDGQPGSNARHAPATDETAGPYTTGSPHPAGPPHPTGTKAGAGLDLRL